MNKISLGLFLLSVIFMSNVSGVYAQQSDYVASVELQPLKKGTNIYNFTGNLSWHTFYVPTGNGLFEESQTQLYVEFTNIEMLNTHFGLGYNFFSVVYLEGFFEGVGLGGVGAGTILRYYPLESTRWQPYLQAGIAGGYNLALSNASGISDVDGFRFRTSLQAGLAYRISNAFGVFFEIGPSWEYDQSLRLVSHAIQFEIGIVLYIN